MTVVAIVDDLLFRAKIETVAAHVGVSLRCAPDVTEFRPLAESTTLVLIDLQLVSGKALEMIQTIRRDNTTVPMIGYGSHVETALFAQATQAGCTLVLPRSAFIQQLPALLQAPR